MTDRPEFLTQEEATRLWQRAAQLQAEAARLAEVASPDDPAGVDSEADREDEEGYALAHVRTAAVEAGIGEEFVEAALADIRAERALPRGGSRWTGGLTRRILGSPDDAITVRRTVAAPARQVLAAMEEVFPAEPYTLSLKDRRGDPARGGLMVFELLGVGFTTQGVQGFKGDAATADLRQVFVSVRPVPGAEGDEGAELTLRAPVSWAFPVNAGLGALFTTLGGGLGYGLGVVGAAAVSALLGPGTATAVAAAAVLSGGTLGGGAGMAKLFRVLYRYGIGRGRVALETLAAAVAVKAQGGWGISAPTSDPQALPGS